MSQSEVFRPSDGPLLIRDNLARGLGAQTAFRSSSSRPATSSGYRFGQLSQNSFFSRHNPHPSRVKHMKGLLDVPICSVNDNGFFSSPRYSLEFPPNNFNKTKLNNGYSYLALPVNYASLGSERYPTNTITGLQKFLGAPLNMRIFREKSVPKIGGPEVTDAWRDELRAMADAIGAPTENRADLPKPKPKSTCGSRPRTSQYSAETGRLIPPPSRAMSRGGPSRGMEKMRTALQQCGVEEGDMESKILQMLCQILQTDDINAVQGWLISAGEREKNMVLEMIRAVLASNEIYYKYEHDPTQLPPGDVGRTIGSSQDADRLTLDGDTPRPVSAVRPILPPIDENSNQMEEIIEPIVPDVFRSGATPLLPDVNGEQENVWQPGKSTNF